MAKKKRKVAKKKVVKKDLEPQEGLYQEAFAFAENCLRDGVSEEQIIDVLRTAHPFLTDTNLNGIIQTASANIAAEFAKDRKSIVSLHVKRYNDEIKRLNGEKFENYKESVRRAKRINALEMLLDVMVAKERVLQLHTKETQIKVYNQFNIKPKREAKFDLTVLTFEEKRELLSLIEKTKLSNSNPMSVQLTLPSKEKDIVEDVEFEVIEPANVESIAKINEPKPVVEYVTDNKQSMADLTEKIRKALIKKAEIEFKKRGAKDRPTIENQIPKKK